MSSEHTAVICRSATDYQRLGFVRGYQCKTCGAELQVSPRGVAQIAAGGVPLCNPCGLALAHVAVTTDPARVKLSENPSARQQREEWEKKGRG